MQDKIEILDDRAQCRKKLHVFFGSRDNFYHPLIELLANGIDEISNNFEKGDMEVVLEDDFKTMVVSDNGRGLPVLGETDGIENYKLLFEKLFAGTKYNVTEKEQTGCNGCGNTVINNTSLFLDVDIYQNGTHYQIKYVNGVAEDGLKCVGKCSEHGSTLRFKLDPNVYTHTKFDPEEIKTIIDNIAAVSNKINFKFSVGKEIYDFHYETFEDFCKEFVGQYATSKFVNLENVEYENKDVTDEDGNIIDELDKVSLFLCTSTEPKCKTWLNRTYLKEGGTIVKGVYTGVKTFANKYCRDNKLFKKGITSFTDDDIESSISFCCNVLSNNPEFQSQTKFATKKEIYYNITRKHTIQALEFTLAENPSTIKKMIKHILEVHGNNTLIEKRKKELKKVLSEKTTGILNRPKKLHDCKNHGKGSMLYIGEGDSALGALYKARNSENQAVTCVRGKILNVAKAKVMDVMNNDTIKNIISILGCGVEIEDKKFKDLSNFDIKNLKYEKIVIATDADPDGFQIRQLLMTFFFMYMPQLVREGRIAFAQTPLYEVKHGDDEMLYIYSEEEKESKLATLEGKPYKISRCKGLGEVDAHILYDTAMNPETRTLIQVEVKDFKNMEEALKIWMQEDTAGRKEIILDRLDMIDLEE